MKQGYISLARGIQDHPVVGSRQPYTRFDAWLWLLFDAAWKERRVRVSNGRSAAYITIQRGQLTHSRGFLASRWGWSVKAVRTFLDRLETDHMIGRQTGQLQTVITICKYESYQNADSARGRQSDQQTGRQWAGNGPEEEEGNKGNKKNPLGWPSDAFGDWYKIYPKHVDRKDAEKSFLRLQASGEISLEGLMAATGRYAAEVAGREKKYIKAPAVWINKGGHLDEHTPGATAAPSGILRIEAPTITPDKFTPNDWLTRIKRHAEKGEWSTHWGPPPGLPGCLVPPSIIAESDGARA